MPPWAGCCGAWLPSQQHPGSGGLILTLLGALLQPTTLRTSWILPLSSILLHETSCSSLLAASWATCARLLA